MIYAATVIARSTEDPGPASTQTYTVSIHLLHGDAQVEGVQPFSLSHGDELDSIPYDIGTQVVCLDVAGQWTFLFPYQRAVVEDCEAAAVLGGITDAAA